MSITIPPLVSGGLMLTYRCTNRCRHCLYACSESQPNQWMTPNTAEQIMQALKKEPRLESIHISGGEAALNMDLLIKVIELAVEQGVPLSYLETNGAWCSNIERAKQGFRRMRDAGLHMVLISASMFHNEFIPFKRTRIAVQAATEIFGPQNLIIWLPNLYQALGQLGDEENKRTLEKFCEKAGLSTRMDHLPHLYNLIPAGRAARALRACYRAHNAKAYQFASCMNELMSVSHFHIDLFECLFTGLCPGIAPGDLTNLHPEMDMNSAPIFYTLCQSGPYGLMGMAIRDYGFEEDPQGYVSKCDLCQEVRRFLFKTGDFYELRPAEFYEGL